MSGPVRTISCCFLRAVAALVGVAEFLHRDGADAEGEAEVRGDFFELQDAARVGLLVDAVDGGDAGVLQVRCHGLVGGEHELLDQAVGDVARGAGDAGHFAELVELDQRFGQVEIDRAAAHALAVQDQRQFLHQLEALHQRAVAVAQPGVAFEQQVDVGIGHPLRAADDAGGELLRDDVALVVDLEQRGEHQAVGLRDERAEVGGELVGQHGDGAVREVDAGAAQARFEIDGRAGADVVADVGDVDVERVVAVGEPVHPDGVVEIARGLAVDGDDGQVAEVAAAGEFGGGDDAGDGLRLFDHFGRELVRAGGACG